MRTALFMLERMAPPSIAACTIFILAWFLQPSVHSGVIPSLPASLGNTHLSRLIGCHVTYPAVQYSHSLAYHADYQELKHL